MSIDHDIRMICSHLKRIENLRAAPQPPKSIDSDISRHIELMVSNGAPHAFDLEPVFRSLEQSDLCSVPGLAFSYQFCSSMDSLEAMTTRLKAAIELGSVIEDLPHSDCDQVEDWPKTFVPLATDENWGFAVNCSANSPRTVWLYDSFGCAQQVFDNLSEFFSALRYAYTDGHTFLDSSVQYATTSQGVRFIDWSQ